MDEGFLRLSRRFFSNEMWNEARTFSSCEAWLDLIQSARFEATPRKESIGGREISYSRGQYPASIRFLSQRWKWSEKKVRSFLVHLRKKGMITVECNQGMNLITLCKYEEYNPMGTTKGTGKGTGIEKEINELRHEWAQLRAQLGAQSMNNNLPQSELLQKSGHTEGTNTKKEEREYIDISLHQKKENTPDGVSKKDKLSSPSPSEKIDYSGLMEYYNTTFKDRLQQIRSMTDVRKKAVKARIAQYGKESVRSVFNLILQSPFLLGANDRNWKCDFDWIFKQANFTKILEGNYNGTRLSKNQQDSEQRKRDSVLAVATTVREAAAKRERNLKQRALLNKYPDPAQFILDYNPDLQFKLVRCNATHSELALNDSIPSLGLLSSTYGDETPIEWLKIQFGSLNDFAEVSTKIAKEQLSELSEIFLSEYYYINAAEICFFIARFKSGKYGRFYGSIDPLKITSAMLDYVSERRKDIERKERERYRNQREKEIEERGNNRISYAEYIEIKHRADAGDEEARKMLISP